MPYYIYRHYLGLLKLNRYKRERRQYYKPTGLRKLLAQVQNKLSGFSEEQVIYAISESMACNYQGIAWNKIMDLTNVPNKNYGGGKDGIDSEIVLSRQRLNAAYKNIESIDL